MKSAAPIGVFDSGFGGLTVLAALRRALPGQDFLYFGDNAHAPIGGLSQGEVLEITRAAVWRLFEEGCGLVILACNTASAIALRPLQEYMIPADKRVLGVLVPMIEALSGQPYGAPARKAAPGVKGRILFFATPATVQSGAFSRELALRTGDISVTSVACDGLVRALERGDATRSLVAQFCAEGLSCGAGFDAAILGCTHYPLAEADFRAHLPKGLPILSQPELTAESLKAYLARNPHFAGGTGQVRLCTSGDPAAVSAGAAKLLGRAHEFEPMDPGS